jgi:hypothetical protein
MLKSLKNAWTLTVNLGWVVVLGVFAAPHFLNQNSPFLEAPPIEVTTELPQPPPAMEIAPKPEPVKVLEPEPSKAPEVVASKSVGRRPIQMMTPAELREDRERKVRQDRQQEQERRGAHRAPGWPQQFVRAPQDILPEKGGIPAVICEGGMCRIDPRYKNDATEPRIGPEPVIYFPQPPFPSGIPPGETPRSSRAREKNRELKFQLNQFKGRLKWTPKVWHYLDLSEMGPCPWELERVFDQNWGLKWRLRQLGLLTQGYDAEGLVPPKRPRGTAGYVGILPQTLGQ